MLVPASVVLRAFLRLPSFLGTRFKTHFSARETLLWLGVGVVAGEPRTPAPAPSPRAGRRGLTSAQSQEEPQSHAGTPHGAASWGRAGRGFVYFWVPEGQQQRRFPTSSCLAPAFSSLRAAGACLGGVHASSVYPPTLDWTPGLTWVALPFPLVPPAGASAGLQWVVE